MHLFLLKREILTYFLNSWLDQQPQMSDDAKRTLRGLGDYDAFEKNVLCEDLTWIGAVAESTRKAISFLEAADWGSEGLWSCTCL